MRKYNFKIIIFVAISILLAISYYSFSRYSKDTLSINGHIFKIETVQSLEAKSLGLSGRESMADNEAMLFIFSNKKMRSFWMKDMNFDIDLLWIDNNKVIGFEKNMLAPTKNIALNQLLKYSSPQPVDKVLEINAGLVENLDIKIGDIIEFKTLN